MTVKFIGSIDSMSCIGLEGVSFDKNQNVFEMTAAKRIELQHASDLICVIAIMPAMMRRRCLPTTLILLVLSIQLSLTYGLSSSSSSSSSTSTPSVSLGTLSIAPIALGTLNLKQDNAADVLRELPPNTLIDTAEIYGKGKCESMIGSAVRTAGLTWGSNVYSATKFAPSLTRRNPESVVKACQESIQRLGCESIDLYQLHYSDKIMPFVERKWDSDKDKVYWEGVCQCYEQGLIKNIGVCNYGPTLVQKAHDFFSQRGIPLVSNQIGYNLMRLGVTKETKQVCDDLGIKVLSYSPLGKGIITGKYDLNDESTFASVGQYSVFRYKRCLKETVALREALERIAASRSKTCAQVVYNWAICKSTIPIAGSLTVQQAQDMLGVTEWSLSEEEVEELDSLSGENISITKEFKLF